MTCPTCQDLEFMLTQLRKDRDELFKELEDLVFLMNQHEMSHNDDETI